MSHLHRMVVPFREIKFAGDGADSKARTFEGLGAAFGNVDAYGDVIEPGAFSQWLSDVKSGRQPWPSMLSQHGGMGLTAEDLTPVGVYEDLGENGDGLMTRGQLAETPRGEELRTLMKMKPRPAIDGLSIGYIAKEWEPRSKPEDPRRRLKRIDVAEISLVTFPANRKARVTSVKSVSDVATVREAEEYLMDVLGASKSEAVGLIARIKAAGLGDPAGGGGATGDLSAELAAVCAAAMRAGPLR